MTTVNVYLNFDGNCEEAFTFYKSVFSKEITYLGRFKDIPPQASSQTIDSKHTNKILHVSLPISQETILMGCDNIEEEGESYKHGNNFSISITSNSKKEADRLFNALSKDGIIQSPMKDAFWGDYFGQFTDKFGINWMIIAEPSSEKADETKKVRGIGGIFFKSKDPVKIKEWYSKHLGLNTDEYGTSFKWCQYPDKENIAYTQWSPFTDNTDYFSPSDKDFMINYRVENLESLLEELKASGVEILDDIAVYEYGKFVHIMDIEGNKIELWEQLEANFDRGDKGITC